MLIEIVIKASDNDTLNFTIVESRLTLKNYITRSFTFEKH